MRRTLNKEKPILFFILGVSLAISLLMWLHTGGFKTNQTCEDDALFYVVGRNLVDFGFIGMYITERKYGGSKAFRMKNVLSVSKTLLELIWEIRFKGK